MKKSNKFSPEVRERAVRMVQEHREEYPSLWAAIESIAPKIGCVPQTLNEWVKRDEVDNGVREGVTTSEAQRMKELEREVKELRRANEILKLASAFFAQAVEFRPHLTQLTTPRAPHRGNCPCSDTEQLPLHCHCSVVLHLPLPRLPPRTGYHRNGCFRARPMSHSGGEFNGSKQHTQNCVGRRSVADEVPDTNLLRGQPEGIDVGALESWLDSSSDRSPV